MMTFLLFLPYPFSCFWLERREEGISGKANAYTSLLNWNYYTHFLAVHRLFERFPDIR